ncbi:MAG TPA: carbamoyltransferase C-terminal domain-containing protein, partial [Prosthecobacter sp.]
VAAQRRLPVAEGAEQGLTGLEKLRIPRSTIAAVTHVDGSARIQSVHEETHPAFHALIREFDALTGCPLIVNTSFNLRGEPVVESPAQAYTCFMRTDMDVLAIGPYLLMKEEQPAWVEKENWREQFQPD